MRFSFSSLLLMGALAMTFPASLRAQILIDGVPVPRALPVEDDEIPVARPAMPLQQPVQVQTLPQPVRQVGINDLARFLAGMPGVTADDVFAPRRHSLAWRNHAAKMEQLWGQYRIRHEGPVVHWANACMGELRSARAVFYPFSGPDFLFVDLFYPNAETYLLCGLEPCDPLPDWNTLTETDVTTGLEGLAVALDSVMQYSYFITKDMKQDFKSTRFSGVLPVFLVFLARTGHTVESVEGVRLDANGKPVTSGISQSGTPGFLIRMNGGGRSKKLYFFSQNVANEACKPNGPLLRFASSLGRPAAFAKSASYLMHEGNFSNIRNHILTQCSGLVQDPSGVPYRNLVEKGWHVQLFGNYENTLPVFSKYPQPDLYAAYANPANRAQAINFSIGYLLDPKTTSLMLAWPGR